MNDEFDFEDIEVVEDNECDHCGREIEPGDEIEYENAGMDDSYWLCPRCYGEVQRSQVEPLEM